LVVKSDKVGWTGVEELPTFGVRSHTNERVFVAVGGIATKWNAIDGDGKKWRRSDGVLPEVDDSEADVELTGDMFDFWNVSPSERDCGVGVLRIQVLIGSGSSEQRKRSIAAVIRVGNTEDRALQQEK